MLTHALKHLSVRTWAALIVSMAVSLYLFGFWAAASARTGMVAAGFSIVFLLVWFAMGRLGNVAVRRAVVQQTEDAASWQQAGDGGRSHHQMRKAVGLCDSFLVSPLQRRRLLQRLAVQIAHLYAARPRLDHEGRRFLTQYLAMHPGDHDVSDHWLAHMEKIESPSRMEMRTAVRIQRHGGGKNDLNRKLAALFLFWQRLDFGAIQSYHWQLDHQPSNDFVQSLAWLLLDRKWSDLWALTVYMRALEQAREIRPIVAGIRHCLASLPPNAENRKWMARAKAKLLDFGVDATPTTAPVRNQPPQMRQSRKASWQTHAAIRRLQLFWHQRKPKWDVRKWLARVSMPAMDPSFLYRRMGPLVGALLVAGLLAWWGTTLFMNPPSPPPPMTAAPAPEIVVNEPVRFTIQVAAYTTPASAASLTEKLKNQKLEAYWSSAKGRQRTWYQVRISRFDDRAAAHRYGKELKQRGIIDDYYVTVYRKAVE